MIEPSPAASSLPASGIREIVNLALARPGVIRLEIGEPDSAAPAHVVEAAMRAAAGPVRYVQSAGVPALREALVDRLARVAGIAATPEQVVVGQGAVQTLFTVLASVVRPGDEVLVPDPAWPNYEMQTIVLGATPVHYRLRREDGYQPDPEEIVRLITPRTRVLVLNTPNNPTGAVIDAQRMAAIVEAAASRGVLVLSDEVYDELVLEGEHVGAHAFAPDSVVPVYSFSKTYAMTGWRVGYAVVPPRLAVAMERLLETQISCLPPVSQAAALAALQGPQDSIAENAGRYRRRRDLAVAQLGAAGIDVVVPKGAFYLIVPLADGADSRAAALELVQRGVATAPGSAFGPSAAPFLRLNLGASEADLSAGIDLILDWYAGTEAGLVRLAPSLV
jgi:aspartate/methionine/tyrosine aminotransferase